MNFTVSGDELEEGMFVERPQWVMDYESGKQKDPLVDVPNLPPVLRVDRWDPEDGESLLSAPDGSVAIDYNTSDYPPTFILVAPHTTDPIFDHAVDVGEDLELEDPDGCKRVTWDPWWRGPPMSPEQEARVRWVALTICFDGDWVYEVALMQGEAVFDKKLDVVSTQDWVQAKRTISDFRQRAHAVDPLDVINRHRTALGMTPLDPSAAGWTSEDLEREASRIARLPNLARLMP